MNTRHSPPRNSTLFLSVLAFVLGTGTWAYSHQGAVHLQDSSPYFADRGRAAIYQRSLDVQNVATVLSFALEPGHEDLATIAYLRIARGARVINLYVTNGEATPSDLSDEPPFRLGARRKEEATRALSYLGAEAYFLNLPDIGVPSGRQELDSAWVPDSLVKKLANIILTYRPDLILLARDFRGEAVGETLRQVALQEMLLQAVRAVAGTLDLPGVTPSSARLRWKVQRVLVDKGSTKQPVRPRIKLQHPITKKTYEKIGDEARQNYQSLWAQSRSWQERGERSYTHVYPALGKPVLSLDGGLVLYSPRLKTIADSINRVAVQTRSGKGLQALPLLASTIDSIDRRIGVENVSGTLMNQKALAMWKNRLERLRCSLLDVDIDFEVSDSLISRSQLFFLRFKKFTAKITKGETFILFPGAMGMKWVINEGLEYQLPFDATKEYRVISPRDLEFDSPTALHGLERPTVGTLFSFIIYHKDSLRERNFQYRKDIRLGVGPRFAAEVLTPFVFATPGEQLVYRFQNFTRDGVYGDAFVEDSVCESNRKRFHLKTKDSWVIDTLNLQWVDSLTPGDHLMELKISEEPVARFVARKFDVIVDTTRRVGLITGLAGSSLKETLRRLKVNAVLLDSSSVDPGSISPIRTILIDRDAASLRPDYLRHLPTLLEWARLGGHLIFFPNESKDSAHAKSLGFRMGPALTPTSEVLADSAHPFLMWPNKIHDYNWEGWIYARAWGHVDPATSEEGETIVRSKESGVSLLVTKKEGSGRITWVALDLSSQLLNIHPGAYRLLANLVSSRYIEE